MVTQFSRKKDAWADYIDYLFQRGIRVSFDGWCNIKYYYESWRPLFREVVNFRTDPLYMDRLHGLEGISGDFETNSPTGMDAQLFEEVYHNVTAELISMRQRMTEVNLTSANSNSDLSAESNQMTSIKMKILVSFSKVGPCSIMNSMLRCFIGERIG